MRTSFMGVASLALALAGLTGCSTGSIVSGGTSGHRGSTPIVAGMSVSAAVYQPAGTSASSVDPGKLYLRHILIDGASIVNVPILPRKPVIQLVPELYEVAPGTVALTFDDGPSQYTESFLKVLNQYHVKATFFFVGDRVSVWPQAVRDAATSGDEIGDHSMSHPELLQLNLQQQTDQIVGAAKAIAAVDSIPVTLFRPPYDAFDNNTERVLQKTHMELALYNRDPRDWDAKTVKEIVTDVLDCTGGPSGGVFDLHENQLTLEALPDIIQGLEKMHLQFVLLQGQKGYAGIG